MVKLPQIQKDIPFPTGKRKKFNLTRLLIAQMEPGDSVLFQADHFPDAKDWRRAAATMAHHFHRTGRQYITQIEGEGLRIWRKE